MEFVVENIEQTKQIAKIVAKELKAGELVKFYGDLGAGKTTMIGFILSYLGVNEPVTSPTFSLLKTYKTSSFEVAHFDMYRIDTDEAVMAGFDEILNDDEVVKFVEWPDNVEGIYPKNFKCISINFDGLKRIVRYENFDN